MEVLEAIRTRRSIRQYKDEPIPPDVIEQLLDAGRWAPSASNSQTCEFIVFTDAELRKKISRSFVFGRFLADAPLGVAVIVDPWRTACPIQDGTLASYAIWLAAHSLGLGACWINPNISRGIKKILGIPATKKLISILSIGYPTESPIRTRRKLEDIVYFEKFGNKKGPISFRQD